MKLVVRILGALLALVVLVVGGQYLASESGEVVIVRTSDEGGATRETRIWIVDDDGAQWIRTGSDTAKWMARVRANPEIEVVRNGETRRYVAVPAPDARARVNELMAQKYGWGDQVVGLVISRDHAQVMRLEPR